MGPKRKTAAREQPPPPSAFPVKMLLHKGARTSQAGDFAPDIEDMLFGFGDAWPADAAVVLAIEDMVTAYIRDLTLRAMKVAECRPGGKLDKECFMFLVRKESHKFKRVHRLLQTNEELKQAKRIEIASSINTHDEG